MDRPHHFTEQDADEVLDSAFDELKPLLTASIARALEERLDQFLATTSLISLDALKGAGIPQVLLRVRTVQTLLDAMKEQTGTNYAENLRNAGRLVGITFGVGMMNLLEERRRFPIDYGALLKFWTLYDSSAGMGILTHTVDESHLHVRIHDNFLSQDYESEPHRHCAFWEGYLQAAVDTVLVLWLRWIQRLPYKPPTHRWVAQASRENRQASGCSFVVELAPENHEVSRDFLVAALGKLGQASYVEAVQTGRGALETVVKEMIGLPESERIKFGALLRVYLDEGLPLSYDRWHSAYGDTSDAVHHRYTHDERAAVRVLQTVQMLLIEANGVVLDREAQERVLRRQSEFVLPNRAKR